MESTAEILEPVEPKTNGINQDPFEELRKLLASDGLRELILSKVNVPLLKEQAF
jgi:hypothetical protein